jgi:hypothetical protein
VTPGVCLYCGSGFQPTVREQYADLRERDRLRALLREKVKRAALFVLLALFIPGQAMAAVTWQPAIRLLPRGSMPLFDVVCIGPSCPTAGASSGTFTGGVVTSLTTFGSAADASSTIRANETAGCFVFEGSTANGFETSLCSVDATADATFNLQALAAGTYRLTAQSGALTATRVPFAGANGDLADDSDLTFATDTLTATKLITTQVTNSSLTSGRVPIASTGGLMADDADLTFATDTLTATKIAGTTLTGTNLATGRTTFGTAADALSTLDLGETAGCVTMEGATADAFESRLCATDPTVGDQTFNLPNLGAAASDTLASLTAVNVFTQAGRFGPAGTGRLAIGGSSTAATCGATNCTAVGDAANASAAGGTAFGKGASATAGGVIALGNQANCAQAGSIVIGETTGCTATGQLVIGRADTQQVLNSWLGGTGPTSAAPIGYVIHGGEGAGTNIVGAALGLSPGMGTGNAASLPLTLFRQIEKATGTGVQTAAPAVVVCKSKILSNTSATAQTIATITTTTTTAGAVTVDYTVVANNGTLQDTDSGMVKVAWNNNAGTVAAAMTAVVLQADSDASGTLAATPTATVATNVVSIKVTPTWVTIVPTTVTSFATFTVASSGDTVVCQ